MRIHERRGQVKEAKGGPEREDEQECPSVAVLQAVTGAIGVRRLGMEAADGRIRCGSRDGSRPLR
jgi:hypothetical protein